MGKTNWPLFLFILLYLRLIFNFTRRYLSQLVVFFILTLGILFVFFKTFSQDLRTLQELETVSSLLVLSLSFVIASFAFPSTVFNKDFVRRNLTGQNLYFLQYLKFFFLSVFVFGVLSIFPVVLGLTSIKTLLSAAGALMVTSLCAPIFLPQEQGKIRKKEYQSVLLKSEQFSSAPTYSSLCLDSIYFLRRNKRNLIGGFICILFSYIFIAIYLVNMGQFDKTDLFIIPFAVLTLFTLDKNVDIYSDLKEHVSSSLKVAFWSDLIFWNLIFFFQWVVSAAALYFLGFKVFPSFLSFLALFPMIISYVLILKFKFLGSRILRAMSAGLSLAAPLIIPILIFMFWVEIKND